MATRSSDPPAERPGPVAYAESVEAVLARLETVASGLTPDDAARRLERVGLNRLDRIKPASAVSILLDQLRSVVVVLLIAAAVISLALGERLDAAAIGAVLAINTVLGFATELRARRTIEGLLRLDTGRALVIREGHVHAVDAHVLVPGDVIQLDAGQQVPADARIIQQVDLHTNEAALTGESLPVSKGVDALPGDTPLADRSSMVYKGTTVATGTARAVVTGTGAATEVGRIGVLVASVAEERTPLERQLDQLGRRLVWLALAVAAVVTVLGIVQGAPLGLVVRLGLALAVAAVPEALPAVATIALAVGVRRMARRHALVRRLSAVEALGSVTVVCTDKTRTLTSGNMSVVRIWTAGSEFDSSDAGSVPPGDLVSLRRALTVAALASRLQPRTATTGAGHHGDPIDAAVLRTADVAGIDYGRLVEERPLVGLVPFSSERQLMASFHRAGGELIAYVKGAPGRILALSDWGPGGEPLNEGARDALRAVNERFAAAGLRVLALAAGPVDEATEPALRGLAFIGFIGLMDPPAPGVTQTIARLRAAGLRTVMLTGDQRLTAEAIGREVGVIAEGADVLDGRELNALAPGEIAARVAQVGAFSRITPEHKLAVVTALQAGGAIVAMLGDGVNDAPALKKADVGVAMGLRGTDVAREAAAIVLQDDRFETIAAAVEEGRIIFDNIRKFVFYLFSCNVAEVLVLLVAGAAGLPLPLAPIQLLWLNMVTDTFPALALAMEPGDEGVMTRPPRDPREAMLSARFLTSVLVYGGLITGVTLVGFLWALRDAPDRAVTMAFMVLALAQTFHLGNARSQSPVLSLRRITANPYAVGAVALVVALQCAALQVPGLRRLLHVVPLSGSQWFVALTLAAIPGLIGQLVRVRRLAP